MSSHIVKARIEVDFGNSVGVYRDAKWLATSPKPSILFPGSAQSGFQAAIRRSFDEVTRFELQGRKVIALGDIAAAQCARHAIEHIAVCHPSWRGYTNEKNATEIADVVCALGFGRAVKENPSTG
jgi:hypothetical protein